MTIQRITEENGKAVIDGWYTRAREMNPSDLGEFVRHLCEDYQHDYGTVVHACAAAAVAAIHEACPGTTWAQADAQALAEVTDRGQRTLAGVR